MAPNMLRPLAGVVLLALRSLGQYPCDSAIPGSWYCESCSPQNEYESSWSGGAGSVFFSSDSLVGWQTMNGQLSDDNRSISGSFEGVIRLNATGNVSADCKTISWSDKLGTWISYTPPFEYYNVHLCPHTHDGGLKLLSRLVKAL
jgi:hypothetical protein